MTSNVILVKKVVLKSESMVSLGELNQNTSGFINMNYRFLQVKMRLQRREIFSKRWNTHWYLKNPASGEAGFFNRSLL